MKNFKNPRVLITTVIIIFLVGLISFLVSKINIKKEATSYNNNVVNSSTSSSQVYVSNGKITKNDSDHLIGSEKALVTIFVYEDNSNIYSAELAGTLSKIYAESSDQVAIIARSLVLINNTGSQEAAWLLECSSRQNKWSEMRDLLFSKVRENGSLNLMEGLAYGKELNLDNDKLEACLTSEEKYAKIEELRLEADKYGVIGAPTMFIEDEMILGARPYDDYVDSNGDTIEGLKSLISRKLK